VVPVLLYAEDNRDDRFLIWKILEAWHHEIDLRFVRDGAEAIAYLAGADGFADRRRALMLLIPQCASACRFHNNGGVSDWQNAE
jgi:hypothetical protein